MGYRTVIILNNDLAHLWAKDAELGNLILNSISIGKTGYFKYGTAIECTHADKQTLGTLDSLTFTPLAHGNWAPEQTNAARDLRLLKDAADKLGYRLVKKSGDKVKEQAPVKINVTYTY